MKHARPDYDCIQAPESMIPADEPVFFLRSSDVLAPQVVEIWAMLADIAGAEYKIVEMAREHAKKMRRWQEEHGCKLPDL